ncbi:MAG: hydantoinase/oxoprolinase family protein [Candidatus Heimdallarchaeota archaeon]
MLSNQSSAGFSRTQNIAVLDFGTTTLRIVIVNPAHPEEPLYFQRLYLPLRTKREELESVLKTLLRSYADYNIRKFILTVRNSFYSTAKETLEFVVDSVTKFIRPVNILFYTFDGNFITTEIALKNPERIISAGWRALGMAIWQIVEKDSLIVDFSAQSTSFISIKDGVILSKSLSNCDRMKNNELIFYGLLETNAAFIQPKFEYGGAIYNLPGELLALTADIFLITGDLPQSGYIIDTTDKKAKFKEDALNRLRNMLCITEENFDEYELIKIAHLIKTRLLEEINQNIKRKMFENKLDRITLTGIGSNVLHEYLKSKDEYDDITLANEEIKTAEVNPTFCIAYIYATQKMINDG